MGCNDGLARKTGHDVGSFERFDCNCVLGHHIIDLGARMMMIVPVDKRCNPFASMVFAGELFARIISSVFSRGDCDSEQRVVLRYQGPSERPG